MEINELADFTQTQQDFSEFLEELNTDLHENSENWEHTTLSSFLEALQLYCEQESVRNLSWQTLAMMLAAARNYE